MVRQVETARRQPDQPDAPEAEDEIPHRGEWTSGADREAERPEDEHEQEAHEPEPRSGRRSWIAPDPRKDDPPKGDSPEPRQGPRGHDWRSADPEPETPPDAEPPKPRSRRWRPPRDPKPPEPAFDKAVEQEHTRRIQALWALLQGTEPVERAALLAALDQALASPVLEQVTRYDQAEVWLAQLVAATAPRSDPLIERLVGFFRWDEKRVGPRSHVGDAVLARRDDLKFLADTRYAGAEHRGAVEALTAPPRGFRLIWNRITPDLGRRVAKFLTLVRGQRPGLARNLDPEALRWWEGYLSRPRLGPLAILGLTLGPVLFGLLAWGGEPAPNNDPGPPLTAATVWLGLAAALTLLNLFAVQWPRLVWARDWSRRAPDWARLGWAPAALALPPLAAVLPPSTPAALALAIAAIAPLCWALVVAQPDRRQLGRPWPRFIWRGGPVIAFPILFVAFYAYWGLLRPGMRFDWRVRAAMSFAYLGLYWLALTETLGPRLWTQMAPPVGLAAAAFVWGAGTLLTRWSGLRGPTRQRALAGLALLAVATIGALWLAIDLPPLRPLAAALVTLLVLVHKTPAAELDGAAAFARDLVMRFGVLVFLAFDGAGARAIVDSWPTMAVYAALLGAGFAVFGLRRLGKLPAMRLLKVAASGVLRYAWIPALLALLLIPANGASGFWAGGLWLVSGVAMTLSGLVRTPWDAPNSGKAPG